MISPTVILMGFWESSPKVIPYFRNSTIDSQTLLSVTASSISSIVFCMFNILTIYTAPCNWVSYHTLICPRGKPLQQTKPLT